LKIVKQENKVAISKIFKTLDFYENRTY